MSSSTQVTFIFPYLTTLEVVTGTGNLANKLGVGVNKDSTFYGNQAMQIMNGLHVQQELSLFDRSILNLMIDRQLSYERSMTPPLTDVDDSEAHEGLMLVVRHCR